MPDYLKIDNFKIKTPIEMIIKKEVVLYSAINEEYNVFAIGKTREEAIVNFKEIITYHFHFYKNLVPDKSMKIAIGLKKKFELNFEEKF